MKKSKIRIGAFPFLIVRNPMKPLNGILHYNIDKDFLRKQFSNIELQEALLVASKPAYDELLKWLAGNVKEGKDEEKLVLTLLKYYVRMCLRSTPFGLFSTISYCEWAQDSQKQIIIPGVDELSLKVRLDNALACLFMEKASQDTELKQRLKYYQNQTIYQVGDQFRYVEYRIVANHRKYEIVSVDYSEILRDVLVFSSEGKTFREITDFLCEMGAEHDEARSYIQMLIDNQLLLNELQPNVTGEPYFERINKVVGEHIPNSEFARTLFEISSRIKSINDGEVNVIEDLGTIHQQVRKLEINFNPSHILQFDAKRDLAQPKLDSCYLQSIKDCARFLISIDKEYKIPYHLSVFIDEFSKRFENREIPLLVALDPDIGVGYNKSNGSGEANSLIDDLFISYKSNNQTRLELGSFERLLLRKYMLCKETGGKEIVFDDGDLQSEDYQFLPDSFSVQAQVISTNENGHTIFIKSTGNPSAINVLARFCYLDNDLQDHVLKIAEYDQSMHPEQILAEVAHLPGTRGGNVVFRPHLRPYEIPYVARSINTSEGELPLDDLLISVKNKKLVLRSRKLQKQVIPRHSTAHTFSSNGLPVYQFLGELQLQDCTGSFGFSWGQLRGMFEFLPRVRYKNCILAPSTWKISAKGLQNLKGASEEAISQGINRLREKYSLPQYVIVRDMDNQLLLNLDVPLFHKLLISMAAKMSIIEFEEFLFDKSNMLCQNGEDIFTNEIVVPLKKEVLNA